MDNFVANYRTPDSAINPMLDLGDYFEGLYVRQSLQISIEVIIIGSLIMLSLYEASVIYNWVLYPCSSKNYFEYIK